MLGQLTGALAGTAKRQTMRRQNQGIGRQTQHAGGGIQEQRQRIALGLIGLHADIGGDARQQHVARDQHTQCFAIQGNMLRAMTVTGDQTPAPRPDLQLGPAQQTPISLGKARHMRDEIIAAYRHALLAGRRQAIGAIHL